MAKNYTDPRQLNVLIRLLKRIGYLPKLLKDPNVKVWNKAAVVGMIAYLITPFDLIPEAMIGLGILDDAVLTLIVIGFLSDALDKYIRIDLNKKTTPDEHMGETIIEDVDYEVVDDKDKD